VQYPVNEIFQSVQGEATYTGTPAVFIRMQGCPVGCGWCDTKHTWAVNESRAVSPGAMLAKRADEADSASFAWMTVDELLRTVEAFEARHVVITGGEPCLYNLAPLTAYLRGMPRTVQIETSGTHEVAACRHGVFVTVSPKYDMAGGFKVLDSVLERADEFKFPVGRIRDVITLRERIAPIARRRNVPLWLQPLSTSPAATRLCIEAATAYGWRLSVQTHKFIGVR
jgi:7-carboxy-7-deazaguanine synthase